jgi:hypothetical protein
MRWVICDSHDTELENLKKCLQYDVYTLIILFLERKLESRAPGRLARLPHTRAVFPTHTHERAREQAKAPVRTHTRWATARTRWHRKPPDTSCRATFEGPEHTRVRKRVDPGRSLLTRSHIFPRPHHFSRSHLPSRSHHLSELTQSLVRPAATTAPPTIRTTKSPINHPRPASLPPILLSQL